MSEVEVLPGPFFVTLSPISGELEDAAITKLFFLVGNLVQYKMSQDYQHGVGNDFIRISKLEVESIEYSGSSATVNIKGLLFVFQGESSDGLPSETELRGVIRDIIDGQSFSGTVKLSGNSQLAGVDSVDFGLPTPPEVSVSSTNPPTSTPATALPIPKPTQTPAVNPPLPVRNATPSPSLPPSLPPTPQPTPQPTPAAIPATNPAPTSAPALLINVPTPSDASTAASITTASPTQLEVSVMTTSPTSSLTPEPSSKDVSIDAITKIGGESNQFPVVASASAFGAVVILMLFVVLLKRQRKKMVLLKDDFEDCYDDDQDAEFRKMNRTKKSSPRSHHQPTDLEMQDQPRLQYDHSPSKSQNCSPVRLPRRTDNPYMNMDSDDRNYVLQKDMLLSSSDPKQTSSYAVLYGSNPSTPSTTTSTSTSTPKNSMKHSALQQNHFQSGDIACVPSSNESISMDSIQFEPDQEWNPDDDIIDYEDEHAQMFVEKPAPPPKALKKNKSRRQESSFTHVQVKNENLIL